MPIGNTALIALSCQYVRHSVVDRGVRIVSHQPLNRQLAGAVEVNQARRSCPSILRFIQQPEKSGKIPSLQLL